MGCEWITWKVRARVNKRQKMLIKAYPPMMRTLLPRDSMSIPCKKHTPQAPWTSGARPSGIAHHECRGRLPYSRMLTQWCIHRRRFQWSRMGFSQQGCRILWTSNWHKSKSIRGHRETASRQTSVVFSGLKAAAEDEGRSFVVYVQRWCRSAAALRWAARWWGAASAGCRPSGAPTVSWHRSPPGCSSPLRCPPTPDASQGRAAASGLKQSMWCTLAPSYPHVTTSTSDQVAGQAFLVFYFWNCAVYNHFLLKWVRLKKEQHHMLNPPKPWGQVFRWQNESVLYNFGFNQRIYISKTGQWWHSTFFRSLLFSTVDEQVTRTLGEPGQREQLQERWDAWRGQQDGPVLLSPQELTVTSYCNLASQEKFGFCLRTIACAYRRPTTCPSKMPAVMKIEVPIPTVPRSAVGAISPRYRGWTQRPMPKEREHVQRRHFSKELNWEDCTETFSISKIFTWIYSN